VLNNRDLNQVTWEQRAMAGDPKFEGSQAIPDFPYAKYAELAGLAGVYCDEPDGVGAAWDKALSSRLPVVLEFKVDAGIAPIPPHATWEQLSNTARALMRDPDRAGLARRGLVQKATELAEKLPGVGGDEDK
jgi:pyruvate dehydrogenase (quinone)